MKKYIIIAIIIILVIIVACSNDEEDTSQQVPPETTETVTEEPKEEPEEAPEEENIAQEEDKSLKEEISDSLSESDKAYLSGRKHFASIDWNRVFTYGATVHYIMDYACYESDNFELGAYTAVSPAEINNAFGGMFNSYIYIYMDVDGNYHHIFYTDVYGDLVEIPIE